MRIELFHLWDCPNSTRVRDFIERHRMRSYVEYRDVDDLSAEEDLFERTGAVDTPCLIVSGRATHDPDQIIAWFKGYFLGDRSVEGAP